MHDEPTNMLSGCDYEGSLHFGPPNSFQYNTKLDAVGWLNRLVLSSSEKIVENEKTKNIVRNKPP